MLQMSQTEYKQLMYGCDIEQFKESLEESISFQFSGPAMCVASLMSDAQEEMASGMVEAACQTLNRAKWVISEYMMKDRE